MALVSHPFSIRRSHARASYFTCLLLLSSCVQLVAQASTEKVDERLDRADALIRLGVIEQGATRSFEHAKRELELAEEALGALGSEAIAIRGQKLARELEALREDLEILEEHYGERFFGSFPLARLALPMLASEEGLELTEQLFHPPKLVAVELAAEHVLHGLEDMPHPHVFIRSDPPDRELETVLWENLFRDGSSTPLLRRDLENALERQDLEAFDQGRIDQNLVHRMLSSFDATTVVILSMRRGIEVEKGFVATLRADSYLPGEVVQGGPDKASLVVRDTTQDFFVFVRDRREQRQSVLWIHVALLALALVWGARVRWHPTRARPLVVGCVIGAALFVFGKVFAAVALLLMRRFLPEAQAMLAESWWWPALLGPVVFLGSGLVAWIGQAKLTDLVPGSRGARAVGSIFALTALGASTAFIAPLLMLDEARGILALVPLLLATFLLSIVFGFAARTGPPVPHYFMVGPLLVSPFLGLALFAASRELLWWAVLASALLAVAAAVRHRIALAHGTEEPEMSAEEAAEADRARLDALSSKLKRR